jgi:hypothetical protein
MKIGIVGARKYRDRQSVIDLVSVIPREEIIITSSCKGVCTWTKKAAEARGLDVMVYAPDLTNIRAHFEVPKRYYERNKEMVEACDILHAFISQANGFTGGTRFEVEYALKLGRPVCIHREKGISEAFYEHFLPFTDSDQVLFLAWQEFFCKISR